MALKTVRMASSVTGHSGIRNPPSLFEDAGPLVIWDSKEFGAANHYGMT
jgi:hypothetical protein